MINQMEVFLSTLGRIRRETECDRITVDSFDTKEIVFTLIWGDITASHRMSRESILYSNSPQSLVNGLIKHANSEYKRLKRI